MLSWRRHYLRRQWTERSLRTGRLEQAIFRSIIWKTRFQTTSEWRRLGPPDRRASRIAAAGISGSSERALTVQFTNAANTKVPRTQRASRADSGSLVFYSPQSPVPAGKFRPQRKRRTALRSITSFVEGHELGEAPSACPRPIRRAPLPDFRGSTVGGSKKKGEKSNMGSAQPPRKLRPTSPLMRREA